MTKMQITLNGKPHTLESDCSVQTLAESLSADPSQIAVERNREIVPRSRWREAMLAEGDAVEIVRFIGGG